MMTLKPTLRRKWASETIVYHEKRAPRAKQGAGLGSVLQPANSLSLLPFSIWCRPPIFSNLCYGHRAAVLAGTRTRRTSGRGV